MLRLEAIVELVCFVLAQKTNRNPVKNIVFSADIGQSHDVNVRRAGNFVQSFFIPAPMRPHPFIPDEISRAITRELKAIPSLSGSHVFGRPRGSMPHLYREFP
jgi:hypothetical protein